MAKKTIKFIGQNSIKIIANNVVTFTDWTSQEYTTKQLSYMVTDTAKDLTQQRELVLANILPEIFIVIQSNILTDSTTEVVAGILKVLEDHNIRRWDLAAIMDTTSFKFKEILDSVVKSYGELFNHAIWKAFWTYNKDKHSAYFFEDIKVSDMKKLIS